VNAIPTALCAAAAGLLLLAASAATAQDGSAANAAPNETQQTMDEIFEAMRFLLPLSIDDERFSDPAQRKQILAALELLERSSGRLESHGRRLEAPFSHLSRSLAVQSRDILERYQEGYTHEARFLILELTETCVACHSRLPSEADPVRSRGFVEQSEVASLPLDERAKLEYATRQFDRALATYESLFASPKASPTDLDLTGHLDDYLELCIRVKGDYARPKRTFTLFAQRSDLTPTLRSEVEHWIESLDELEKRTPDPDPVAFARTLVEEAQDTKRFRDERDALVNYVAASGILHRYVTGHAGTDGKVAEAYYLLGLIETKIGRSFWLSQAEAMLETSIRLAPGTPTAQRAFALLEDFLVAGYTGSDGTHVPPDIQARLDALQKIAEQDAPTS
jgi:hypothetical protein